MGAISLSALSISNALGFALRFVALDFGKIVPRVYLPALAGGLVLYLSLDQYLVQLERYLGNPSDRAGSLVLGVFTAGFLVTLFAHATISTAVASIALQRDDSGWRLFCVSRRTWRVYAAHLRFLLLCTVLVFFVESQEILVHRFGGGDWVDYSAAVVLVIAFTLMFMWVGLLITPVAVAADSGPVIRESSRLSCKAPFKLAIIAAAVLAPIACIETIGEIAIQAMVHGPAFGAQVSHDMVAAYRAILPFVVIVIGVTYLIGVTLVTAAACAAYRQINGGQVSATGSVPPSVEHGC